MTEVRAGPTPLYSLRGALPGPVWRLYRALRTVLVASAFAGFWVGAVLLAWLVLPATAAMARGEAARRRGCQGVVAASFRLFHGYMRALRLVDARRVGSLPTSLGGRPAVLVANHTTLVDVTAILSSLPAGVCVLAKDLYLSNRFVGRLLRLCGFISAGSTLAERGAAVDEAVQRLGSGFHVLVFPEGTRSPEGHLHRFQRGAFEIACRAGAPVVPLVLRCDPSALRRGQRFWNQPDECARLTIEVGAAIDPAECGRNSRQMRRLVEERYRSWLGIGA